MDINEIYYIKNGEKIGPIKLSDIHNYDISLNTLIWFQGQSEWKKIADLQSYIGSEILAKIPPDHLIKNKPQLLNKKKFKLNYNNYRDLFFLFMLSFVISSIIYLINVNEDNDIKIFNETINNYVSEFNGGNDSFCEFGDLPEFIDDSELLRNKQDYSDYILSSTDLKNEIRRMDKLHYDNLKFNFPEQAVNYNFLTNAEVENIYADIRCIFHNRSIDFKKDLENEYFQISLLIGFCLIFLFYLIYYNKRLRR